ncbi:MAG: serine hydrolase [Pseudomonadota bacterium]
MLRDWTLKSAAIATLAVSAAFSAPTAHAEKYASIVIDAETDTVLHARHADAPRYPASLTKVMTLYMLFDELKAGRLSLDDRLSVSRTAASQPPSNIRLRAGSTIRVSDAISALVTKSANDVAVVVAEHIGGSETRFARLMTVKAADLGLTNTVFRNASGLPDTQQLSTARDMARLAEAMLEDHADYYHYFETKRFAYGGRTYKNHNELLGDVEGVDGIKTGYTRASGFNLMASAKRDGNRVIAVMLGGHTSKSRNSHVTDLIEAAYTAIEPKAPHDVGLRTRIAFQSVTDPVHPNAAAVPTLNGKPLVLADAGSVAPRTPTAITAAVTAKRAQPSAPKAIQAAPKAAPETVSTPANAPAVAPKLIGIAEAARLQAERDSITRGEADSGSTNTAASVSDYEAAQFSKY